jgi:hypothetical protein
MILSVIKLFHIVFLLISYQQFDNSTYAWESCNPNSKWLPHANDLNITDIKDIKENKDLIRVWFRHQQVIVLSDRDDSDIDNYLINYIFRVNRNYEPKKPYFIKEQIDSLIANELSLLTISALDDLFNSRCPENFIGNYFFEVVHQGKINCFFISEQTRRENELVDEILGLFEKRLHLKYKYNSFIFDLPPGRYSDGSTIRKVIK